MKLHLAIAVTICTAAITWGQGGEYVSPPEDLPRRVEPQPVPFSHKLHAEHRITCNDCHRTAETSPRAGLPEANDCMACHQTIAAGAEDIRRLAQMAHGGASIEWVRVYESPGFVFFSHREHLAAGEKCESCHGDVTRHDVLVQEVSISMNACMNCHRQRGASNECYVCHELGQ